MNWMLIALLAPLLWGITNFIDKYLISKYFKSNTGTLVLYSSFIGFPVALLILLFKPAVLQINPLTAFLVIMNSFLLITYLFPYLKALGKADTSVVVTIFQTIPVFSFFLGFFLLQESLSIQQILGSLLIIIGAIGVSLNFSKKRLHLTYDVLLLQLLASFIIALNYSFFKFFALQIDFWTVSFWQYTGFAIFGTFLFIFSRNYRDEFLFSFRNNGKSIIGLNVGNEILNIIATIIFSFAILLAPLALVWTINGFQPMFVFLIGIILTLMFPHIIKEDLSKSIIIGKFLFILLILFGTYVIGLGI